MKSGNRFLHFQIFKSSNQPIITPRHLYLFGLALLMVGMPLSKFMMSVGQFFLAAAFLLEGNFKTKTQWFLINTPALVLCGVYLIDLIGVLYTSNHAEAWWDLRIKLPLLVLPILIATAEPLNRKQFENLLFLFVMAVFAGSVICLAVLTGIIYHPITDIRDIFIFHISHVRFALFTCLSIFIIIYLLWWHAEYGLIKKASLFLLLTWLLLFLVIIESVTGISILIIVAMVLLIYYATRKINWGLRLSAILLLIAIPFAIYYFVGDTVREFYSVNKVDVNTLEKTTRYNHPYIHLVSDNQTENGYRIWLYVCEPELREEWNKVSSFSYDSVDMRGQSLRFTLIRYMTSKGLRKDADGIKALTDEDIHIIEHGVANVNYQGVINLKARINQIIWEYNNYMEGGNPSGHSVMQRIEFWKAAWGVFKEHFWTGVGTGDLDNAYQQQYIKMNSQLDEEHRFRAHNQYLAIGAAFGIFGLLYFLLSLIYPMKSRNKVYNFLYITFWITAIVSMLAEDTFETQAGVTFFAFFNSFYLFAYDLDEKKI